MQSPQLKMLERFVLRARIVQDHSLARDIGVLRNLASHEIKMIVTRDLKTGETGLEMKPVDLLPTEQLESAAARVRPIFLKSDNVHYSSVLDVLAGVLKGRSGAAEVSAKVKELRTKFQQADPDYPHGKPKGPWEGGTLNNKQLSGAWLYGHLLHEDEVRRSYRGGMYPEEMYLAAMRTVCNEMLAVLETLHLIENMQVGGWLELPENIFTDDVTVTATSWVQPGTVRAYVAPMDTPLPTDLSQDLVASGWKDVADEFLTSTPEQLK